MRAFVFFIITISLFSCSVDLNKKHKREVNIVEISTIKKIEGIQVVKMEIFNIIGVNNGLLERQIQEYKFYVANVELIPKHMLGQKYKKAQGYFGGINVEITYKILRPQNPLILTLTEFKVNKF